MKAMDFLRETGFLLTGEQYEDMEYALSGAMTAGLSGGGGLPMLPSYLPVTRVKAPRRVIVLDVGGTHLRTAVVSVAPGEPAQVTQLCVSPTPGTLAPVTREGFFLALAEAVKPIVEASDCIGLCFSFACEILPDRDARVLYLDKELQVEGLAGAKVGEGLLDAMASLGLKHDHRVTVLNDTVAALLGALAADTTPYDGYVGMILGTGFNCCYNEANMLVRKDKALMARPGRYLINTECGAFDAFPMTEIDRRVHAACADGSHNALEKAVSGAYQGMVLTELLKAAKDAGVIRAEAVPAVTARDACDFITDPDAPGVLRDLSPDGEEVLLLTRGMIARAAGLAGSALRGVMRRGYMGLRAPACIAAEGSAFWGNALLREGIIRRVESGGRTFRLLRAHDANLTGAAVAALTE